MERLTLGQTLTPVRKVAGVLFMGLVVVLMLLPFVATFNELLTRIVENSLFVSADPQLLRTDAVSYFP